LAEKRHEIKKTNHRQSGRQSGLAESESSGPIHTTQKKRRAELQPDAHCVARPRGPQGIGTA